MHHLTPMEVVAKGTEKTVYISLDWKHLPSQCCNNCLCCCSWHWVLNLRVYRYNMLYSIVLDPCTCRFYTFVVPESSLCPVVHLSAEHCQSLKCTTKYQLSIEISWNTTDYTFHPCALLLYASLFLRPRPPNMGISRQNLHTPQFPCKQPAHTPHCFFLFFPEGLGNCFNLPVYIFYHLPVYNFYQC